MNPYRILYLIGMLGSCSAYSCTPSPAPVPPVPDSGDGGVYAACCAAIGDTAPECPRTLQHVVETKLTPNATACAKCGLACP